jgi:hypothetical protein
MPLLLLLMPLMLPRTGEITRHYSSQTGTPESMQTKIQTKLTTAAAAVSAAAAAADTAAAAAAAVTYRRDHAALLLADRHAGELSAPRTRRADAQV